MQEHLTHDLNKPTSPIKLFSIVIMLSLLSGVGTGYFLSQRKAPASSTAIDAPSDTQSPKKANQDTKTFRDFAEGKIEKKPDPKPGEDYTEGTHYLVQSNGKKAALTSSVVDLSEYEGKDVKVLGETQKAVKEGWLMDVGRVEVK